VGYRPKKWPDYALEVLDNCRLLSEHIRVVSRKAQVANIEGDHKKVGVYLADIREANAQIDELLAGAKTGQYKRFEYKREEV
jgi:hypothetical protein